MASGYDFGLFVQVLRCLSLKSQRTHAWVCKESTICDIKMAISPVLPFRFWFHKKTSYFILTKNSLKPVTTPVKLKLPFKRRIDLFAVNEFSSLIFVQIDIFAVVSDCTFTHPFISSSAALTLTVPRTWLEDPCCRQMPSNEKVNCKQRDKAGRRVSGPASDLAFRDVSISLLAHRVRLSATLSVVKDTRPIRAYRI